MKRFAQIGTAALTLTAFDSALAEACPTRLIQNQVNNCSSCHAVERQGLDSPAVQESVRIGQAVIDQLGNYHYQFYHDHAQSCRGTTDVIHIVPRNPYAEAEAAIIMDQYEGSGKTLLKTRSVNGLVQELQYYLIERGITVPSTPDSTFPPTSDYYQRAVNEANRRR